MGNCSRDFEMFAVFDPRALPRSLGRPDPKQARSRREAQWATWQMDRSWLDQRVAPATSKPVADWAPRRRDLPWILISGLFVALGVVGAGLFTVGIEKGLL